MEHGRSACYVDGGVWRAVKRKMLRSDRNGADSQYQVLTVVQRF